LRFAIGPKKPGKPSEFKRQSVDKGINKLQKIASHALARKLAKSEFEQYASTKKAWHIKGHGITEKKPNFEEWFRKTFPKEKPCIYAFWGNNSKCIYIGKTGSGGSRPSSHFDKYWFPEVKRIDVYPVNSQSQVPKLECLAIHHFEPKQNKNKAATKKWTKACPLCVVHKDIEKELRRIFRFK
jgi:hypothetical protein